MAIWAINHLILQFVSLWQQFVVASIHRVMVQNLSVSCFE